MKPDLSTLRLCRGSKARPWCCATSSTTTPHEDVPHSPRAMLKKQVARLPSWA
jgi:hypothetical protein